MALPRKIVIPIKEGDPEINVYDISTQTIIFTGNKAEVAIFLGITDSNLRWALGRKGKIKKKFAVRYKTIKPE
jgi:hypothetical protein